MTSRISKRAWLIITVTSIIAVGALTGSIPCCSYPNPSNSTLTSTASNQTPASNETTASEKTLDFTLPALTGANVTLSELKGTPVVLNFWSTCCPYCRQQMPYLEDVGQQSGGEIKVIAISIYDSASGIQDFFGNHKPSITIALDSKQKTFLEYCSAYENALDSIPFTLFIDSEGIVRYAKIGAFASEAELWDTIHSVF